MVQITLKDIAAKAKVTPAAVSKILNNKAPWVGDVTRERVKRIAEELDYQPNYMGQSLRSGKRMEIGVIGASHLNEIQDPQSGQIYSGIGEVVEENGFYLTFVPHSPKGGKEGFEKELLKIGRSKMVDGLILLIYPNHYNNYNLNAYDLLKRMNIPLVIIHHTSTELPFYNVGFDARRAGELATTHLIEQGYRDIMVFYEDARYGEHFFAGATSVLKNFNLPVQGKGGQFKNFSSEQGYQIGKQILANNRVHEGYVICSDRLSLGFMDALKEAGKNVPADVGIVSCDNLFNKEVFRSPLTTVDRKYEDLGRNAARLMFDQIENHHIENKSIILEPELVVRRSTKKK